MIAHTHAPAGSQDRRLILYVEDDVALRASYATNLRRAGFRVAEADNGDDGFARALELHPDLVLVDVCATVTGGRDAAARFKAHPDTSHIPVLALSADDDDEPPPSYDARIAKPLPGPEVVRHVLHFLARLHRERFAMGARAWR